jgi:hypothetical protein
MLDSLGFPPNPGFNTLMHSLGAFDTIGANNVGRAGHYEVHGCAYSGVP